jgi:transposase-like protein
MPKNMLSEKMKCAKCSSEMKEVLVNVCGANNKVVSYQCTKCDYYEFEPKSSQKAIDELREIPLKIKQKIVKLSQDRQGIYFNSHIVRSLNLKKGEEIYLSVPDKKRIIIELEH